VIDENTNFGGLSFSPLMGAFGSAAVANDGAGIAGYVTNYIITFTTPATLPVNSWFRLEFPTGFSFASPLSSYVMEDNTALTVATSGQVLMLTGLQNTLTAGTYRIKVINIRNPYTATNATGSFIFEALQHGVNTVIYNNSGIAGVAISTGEITGVTVVGRLLVKDALDDYTIRFLP
jgi:hypothetical protein